MVLLIFFVIFPGHRTQIPGSGYVEYINPAPFVECIKIFHIAKKIKIFFLEIIFDYLKIVFIFVAINNFFLILKALKKSVR